MSSNSWLLKTELLLAEALSQHSCIQHVMSSLTINKSRSCNAHHHYTNASDEQSLGV